MHHYTLEEGSRAKLCLVYFPCHSEQNPLPLIHTVPSLTPPVSFLQDDSPTLMAALLCALPPRQSTRHCGGSMLTATPSCCPQAVFRGTSHCLPCKNTGFYNNHGSRRTANIYRALLGARQCFKLFPYNNLFNICNSRTECFHYTLLTLEQT